MLIFRLLYVVASLEKAYKNLKEMDPKLVFLEKPFTKEQMIEEIQAKIG